MQRAISTTSYFSPKMAKRDTLPDQEKVRDRLRQLMEQRGIRPVHLAAETGIQNSKISNVLNGKDAFTRKDALKVERAYGVRAAWLELGNEPIYHPGGVVPPRAEPMKEGECVKVYVNKHGGPAQLAKLLKVSRATVTGYFTTSNLGGNTKQAIAAAYHTTIEEILNYASTNKPIVYMSNRTQPHPEAWITEDVIQIIRIPVGARASFNYDEYFSDNVRDIEYVDIPKSYIRRKEVHGVIEVNGDSMQNTLQSGHDVLAYVMNESDWPYAKNIVAIEFRDQFVIKRVADNGLLTNGLLTLSSDNPSGGMFRVPKDEIRRIWQVIRNLGGPL